VSIEEDRVTHVMRVLSHPIRRAILMTLRQSKSSTFSELMRLMMVDAGTLGFHLKRLGDFVKRDRDGKYVLTEYGSRVARFLDDVYHVTSSEGLEIAPTETFKLLIAEPRKRAIAYLIDLCLALGVFLILPWIGAPFRWSLEALFSSVERNLLFLVLFWVYATLFEGFSGQTIGKMLIGIKVVRVGGKPMSYEHAAIRNFGKAFLLPIDLYIGMKKLRDEVYIRFFDKFAGTTVISVD
jgi:uncharacterized RDD family membrane protein YckC/DNA-binding transcriptional ArsR family regulator